MKKRNVIFRVDGNPGIGLGHLIRSAALAQMLCADFEITFVCREIPPGIQEDFKRLNFSVILIKNEDDFIEQLSHEFIVVLDGYHFDGLLQQKIKNNAAKLICIDDLHDKEFYADFIINHVPGVTKGHYKAKNDTQFALGTDYALLRPAFLSQQRLAEKPCNGHVFICFGGSDPENLTAKVLSIVLEFNKFEKISIVTGAAYGFTDSLNALIAGSEKIKHYHAINENEMASLMSRAAVGIVPASGILYEMLALNRVVITGMYIENQRIFLQEFSKMKNVILCGNFSTDQVRNAIAYFFAHKFIPEPAFDGQSGKRLLRIFNQMKKRIYIITGANGGLGEALANIVLSQGHSVLSISRKLTVRQSELLNTNPDFYFIEQDYSLHIDSAKFDQLQNIAANFSEIIFISNAGTIQPINAFEDIGIAAIQTSWKINIEAPTYLISFLLKQRSAKSIDFVNITSGAANRPIANWALYSAAKAYMFSLFSVLTEEHKESPGIRFLSIDPGMIDTKMQQQIRSSDFPDQEIFIGAKEQGKLATAEEAALKVLHQINS